MRCALPGKTIALRILLAAASAAAGWAAPATAQANGDKVWLEVSGYSPSIETRARIDSATDGSLGTEIGFESDLNFDDEQVLPAVLAGLRLGSRFSLTAEYFSLDRSSTVRLQRDITFGDVTYPVAASVAGDFKTDIYRLAVNYAVIRRATFDAGVSAGVHATDVEVSIEGDGRVGGAAAQFERRTQSLLAPLPTVGVFANARVMPDLVLAGRVDYFSLSVGRYDATLLNAQIAATYRIHRNIGLGIGYRHVEYKVIAAGEHLVGRVDYNFDGPNLFVRMGF